MNSGSFNSFGAGSGFNTASTNLFSSNTSNVLRTTGTSGGIFGSTPNQPALGTASQPQQGSIFASSFGGFSSGAAQTQQPVGTTIKFVAPVNQDSINRNGSQTTINTNHQCITAMKEYESKSLEELRFEDYQANRKFPSNQSQFSSSTIFSTTGSTSGFGGSNLFGSTTTQANRPLLFGSSTATTTPTQPQTSLFGQTTQTNPANRSFFGTGSTGSTNTTSGFSGFGSQPATQNVFGSQQPAAQPSSLFGGIGQNSTTTSGGLFGSSNLSATNTGGIFSQQANKSLFSGGGFGTTGTPVAAQPAQTSPFTFNTATTTPASTSTSIFGSQATTQSPISANKPFGSTGFGTGSLTSSISTGFGNTTTTGTTGGIFGSITSPATQQKTGFGTTGTGSTFGGFGATTAPAASTSTGIFGGFGSSSTSTQPSTGLSLTSTATPFGSTLGGATSLGGSTFGNTTPGSLFGSTTTQPAVNTTTGGIFGSQPTTGFGSPSLSTGFGTTSGLGGTTGLTNTGGSLFGSSNTQQTSQFGLGLGLNTSTTTPGTSFLSGTTTSGGFGGFGSGLSTGQTGQTGFGSLGLINNNLISNQQQLQQQQQLQMLQQQQSNLQGQDQPLVQQQLAALSNSPYGGHLLRNTLQDMDKKEDIFKPLSPIAQRPYITEATSPVKITSILPSSVSDGKGGLSQTIKIMPKPLNPISLNKKSNDLFEGLDEEVPCFYPRKNIKKLLFKPSCNTSLGLEINTSRRSSANSSVNGDHKVDFMGRKTGFQDESLRFNTNHNVNDFQGNYLLGQITTDSANVSEDGGAAGDNQSEASNGNNHQLNPANVVLDRPGYFIIPALQDLTSYVDVKGDCLVDNFAIGRVDYGCITFPGITNITNMNFDEIVHIRRKEVHVYPDDTKKPPIGQGLNKPAEITLHRIWPTDKETKKPITDPNRVINMGYNKKIEKVTEEMGAQFIDYDPSTGSWTFKVKHFSKYGFHDSDDEDERIVEKNRNSLASNVQLKTIKTNNLFIDNENEFKQEKDMIQKQLKLIEARRLELAKQAKYNIGTNLNTLKNQQWEMLNEYSISSLPVQQNNAAAKQYSKISVGHLDLSSDSQEIANDDYLEDDDKESIQSNLGQLKKNSDRKAMHIENQNQIDEDDENNDQEDNKENSCLYPSLRDLKNKKLKDKIYPSLNGFEAVSESYKFTSETYQKNSINNLDMDNKDYLKGLSSDMIIREENFKASDLPFVVSSSDIMMPNTCSNRSLMKAFFSEDVDDFSLAEEETRAKLAYLMHKPQQFGLVKKGLGGISNEELFEKKPFKKETALDHPKQLKNLTAMFLNIADVQQRIDSKALRPKLWNRFLLQRTLKLGMVALDQTKTLDQYELDENLAKNEYNRCSTESTNKSLSQISFIKYSESITKNLHRCIADPALFQSHRFRVSWSMNPTAITYTNIDFGISMTNMQIVNLLSPSTIFINNSSDSDNLKLNTIRENSEKYLNIQLELTDFIEKDSEIVRRTYKLPLLRPRAGNDLIKKFFECTQEIRNQIGDHPDADNVDHMKSVWSLCQNLWGDIPDSYKIDSINPTISNYEIEQIRKRLLSEWLTEVSAHRVERQCKMHKFNKKKENHLDSMFCLLTGNRLLDACTIAADNQDYRLALLMTQASGGSKAFRDMVNKQINEWLMSGADKYLNTDRLKLYLLLSGNIILNSLNNDEQLLNACENLDWKRQLGLHLWYKCLPINSIHDALNYFEENLAENICVKPLPPYLEDKVTTSLSEKTVMFSSKTHQITSKHPANSSLFNTFGQFKEIKKQCQTRNVYDTCFHLIKLYCNENYSIADTVAPLSHSPNQLDFRLSWHLTMALVSLNYKYISKESLENLHISFASQLQTIGLWHWSIFVLMHIENEQEREKYTKNYISRYVTSESDLNEKERFITEKLKVPAEWIYDFKAHRAKYECLHENQLKLLIKAHQWNEAHAVLIEILGPEFYIKKNFKTLNDYLITLSKEYQSINKWNLGGQVYLDAIKLKQKAQILFEFSHPDSEKKILDDEILKEFHDQIANLSSRIKELRELNCLNSKKLLVCIKISKLLLNFFNVLMELNNNSEISENQHNVKILTKQNVEKAFKLTNSVPSHDLIQTMLMKKTKFARDLLMSGHGF